VSPQRFTVGDIKRVIRQRKWLIITPFVIVSIASVLGALLLPRKYESTTTIWVQRDAILNPLVTYQMAVTLASVDRLETFSEIVYSRKTIEIAIDSLDLGKEAQTGIEWDELIQRIRREIRTGRKSMNTFSISYTDTDPVRAQRMVSVLANVFIETRLRGESQRNELTVRFFEEKLQEYEQKFDQTQNQVLTMVRERMAERPTGLKGLMGQLESIDRDIAVSQKRLKDYNVIQSKLGLFPDAFRTDQGKAALAELQSADIPNGEELRTLVARYTEISLRYTPQYPEMGKVEFAITELLNRISVAVQNDIAVITDRIKQLQKDRADKVQELVSNSVDQQVDIDKESYYKLYRRLYDEMKVKLEQAKTVRELGRNAESSFIIIDPARVPAKPSKPNKPLIIMGGIGFGLILGIVSAIAAELLDTRIRTPYDIEVYKLPVIALLPEGRSENHSR
jgi:succinoglycan biosynthesis transport protein ExoP